MNSVELVQQTDALSASAKANILQWLTEEKFSFYTNELEQLIEAQSWQVLEDNFFRILPFGTGGRRGTVGIGSGRINRVTVGETTQALCDYLKELSADIDLDGVAIAYDSRLTSKEFATYCAEVLAGNGLKSFIFDGPRATPELSFTVRHLQLDAGIVITASHNPSSDNGIKLYWQDGGQLVAPHDGKILEMADAAATIQHTQYEQALQQGLVHILGKEVDDAYFAAVLNESKTTERSLKVAYSPLHGTGITSVSPVLKRAGFDVQVYEPQATLDGNFTNVTNNIPNPEVPEANDALREFALQQGCDIAVSNDPDADRYCINVLHNGEMVQLTGNQGAVLMTDYLLSKAKQAGEISDKHFIASTIVTTDMLGALAAHYGVRSVSNLLVGFKYIGEQVHLRCDKSNEVFVCGGEESYGGVVGTYSRDKDGAAPSLILAEYAAELKKQSKTLIDRMNELYVQHGFFHEELDSFVFAGANGSETMKSFMHYLRNNPPQEIGGITVEKIRDYITAEEIPGKAEDVLRFEFTSSGQDRVTVRPSGTEPKLKLYVQVAAKVEGSLQDCQAQTIEKAQKIKTEMTNLIRGFNG